MGCEKEDKEKLLYRLREMADILGVEPEKIEHHLWMTEEMHRACKEACKYLAEGDFKRTLQWIYYYQSIREADDLFVDQFIDILERMVGWKE